MALKIFGAVLSTDMRTMEWLDQKTGQRKSRKMQDIRFMVEKDICCLSIDAEKAVEVKAGQKIEIGIRKCDEKSGFYTIYGDVISIR